MARNRMLNPEFWLDEKLAKLSPYARLLYQGLWGICDDNYATLPNRPEWIKAQVFPYEKVHVEKLLVELSESNHLTLFQEKDEEFWYIKNFFKYQKIDRPSKPKYPQFEANSAIIPEDSTSPRPEVKVSKVKLSKVNNTNVLVNPEYGNPDINELTRYFLSTMKLPREDCTQVQSRKYWNLLLKESKTGLSGIKWLIDLAISDEFYKNNLTSSKDLYYKRVKLMARKRGDKPQIAVVS